MNRRLVIKTVLICTGVFLMLTSAIYFYISSTFDIDTGKTVKIVTASADIKEGMIINESMLRYRQIKASAVTVQMLSDFIDVIGRKAANTIPKGEYIRNCELIAYKDWYDDDEKKIVLPVERDNCLAYAVEKGSCLDIKYWPGNMSGIPETVLSKVIVHEIFDESGMALEKCFGNKKAYLVLILGSRQRDRLYRAMSQGKLLYEQYCSKLQKPVKENYTPD